MERLDTARLLLDTLMDGLMILIALRLMGRRARPWRVLLSALMGAAAALACGKSPLTRAQQALLWFPLAMLMMAAAGGGRPVRGALVLLAAAGLLGGMIQALQGAVGSLGAAYALGAMCVAAVIAGVVRAGRAGRDVRAVRVRCRFRGRQAAFDAMVDSGNCLRDYLTHRPVIVLPESWGEKKLGIDVRTLRPIFADTAGGRLMMGCFVPEETEIVLRGEGRAVRAAIAFSPGLGASGPALLPESLLREI